MSNIDPSFPPKLFKYRSLTGCGLEWTRQLIVEGKLWFASPRDFNDPFDTLPDVRMEGSPLERRARIQQMVMDNTPGLSPEERRAKVETMEAMSPEEWQSALEQTVRDAATATAVCSFTTRVDDVLMWSHYADHHRGLCVRFSTGSPYFEASLPFPVRYQSERPVIDWMKPNLEQELIDILLTKAAFWAHEGEWRQIETGAGARQLPRAVIEAVYLGCRASCATRDLVRAWLEGLDWPVELHVAREAHSTFSLEFDQIR